jgi:hypothetical protein
MALFGKTDEEKAEEARAEEAARLLKAEADAAAEVERQRAAFAASPAGQAQSAKAAGRRYLQIVRDVTVSSASTSWLGDNSENQTDQSGMIESVEDQGWVLHDVGYVFQETGADSTGKSMGVGERTAISGKIVGVYLFRVDRTAVAS